MPANVPSDNQMHEILPYEALSEEIRSLVDADAAKLHEMQDTELMQYGWDLQNQKTEIINEVISGFETLTTEEIDAILDDIMDSQKSVIPRPRRLFSPEYRPTSEDKRQFVGKVGDLEELLSKRIDAILSNNAKYIRLIHECKNMVDRHAICMMAIDKYLSETNDQVLRDVLLRKKQSLAAVRMANMQSALMYMKLYQNNAMLVNHLNEVIHLNLHQLQEQVLIQTETNEIKNALKECQNIKDSIQNLALNNIQELGSTGDMLKQTMSEPQTEETEKKMQELVASLSLFSTGPDVPSLPSEAVEVESKLEEDSKEDDFSHEPEENQEDDQQVSSSMLIVKTSKGYNYRPKSSLLVMSVPGWKPRGYISTEWFKEAEEFYEGFARVKRFHRRGYFYINEKGKVINKKGFPVASNRFYNGFAIVGTGKEENFLKPNGELLSKISFFRVDPFHNGLAVVENTEHAKNYLKTDGHILFEKWSKNLSDFDGQYGLAKYFNGRYVFLDCHENILAEEYFFEDARTFHEDFAAVKVQDKGWNFIGRNGKFISHDYFFYADNFHEGFAVVGKYLDGVGMSGEYFNYIDTQGNLLLKDWQSGAEEFRDGIALIKGISNQLNFVNKEGKVLCPVWFSEIKEANRDERIAGEGLFVKLGLFSEVIHEWYQIGYDGKMYNPDGSIVTPNQYNRNCI